MVGDGNAVAVLGRLSCDRGPSQGAKRRCCPPTEGRGGRFLPALSNDAGLRCYPQAASRARFLVFCFFCFFARAREGCPQSQ